VNNLTWYKSSKSTNNGQCVEVAFTENEVRVRDSKYPQGAELTFTFAEWRAFTDGVKNDEFNA
jgi:beta-glucanase (GH16 family)